MPGCHLPLQGPPRLRFRASPRGQLPFLLPLPGWAAEAALTLAHPSPSCRGSG